MVPQHEPVFIQVLLKIQEMQKRLGS